MRKHYWYIVYFENDEGDSGHCTFRTIQKMNSSSIKRIEETLSEDRNQKYLITGFQLI